MKIIAFFVGTLHDNGFNSRALAGAERARALPGAQIEIVSGVPFDLADMLEALNFAAAESDGVVFIGGQGNQITPQIASLYPDRRFAIVQGEVTATNLASYDVLQEQSAFLAGCLAARMTRTGTVAHLSGHRVTPGLKGRAAFVAGVRHLAPEMPVLTGFCGSQDDSTVTESWARAQASAGAGVLFTMLNAARDGASDACRASGMRQIGNATDWCAVDPAVFVGSAVAQIDLGVEQAIADMLAGRVPAEVVPLGLAQGAVSLTLAPDVPAAVAEEMAQIATRIAEGTIPVPTRYTGPEFTL
ncbi:BMP family protein [Pararhodobacter zhoushanensis]|uniref:BMP family protein n=1 Tax=Pararhodobacter zhoushanensis TaxID=2479545 RepID=UPI000F8CBCA2|nr:BMP family protein [Pararhodobacter zhoushanensis]